MSSGDESPESGVRRTGVVRRTDLTRQRPSTARRDWLALVSVAGLSVIVLLILSGMFNGPFSGPSGPPASTFAVTSPTHSLKPTYTPEASATPTPSPTPSSSPSPSPTPSPSPSPSPSPTPVPSPTAPAYGLVIIEPKHKAVVSERTIIIRGLAQPNVTIVREVPFWFDQPVLTDGTGRWSMAVELNPGENTFVFRVGDDAGTRVTLTVYYTPG